MSRIRSEDTKPEIRVRSFLYSEGFRYRLHVKELPGKPDLVLKKYNTVIFVHGCYWHRHPDCRRTTTPKTRTAFWEEKFKRNIERDKKNILTLKELGWDVIIIWECETEDERIMRKVLNPLFINRIKGNA